MEPGSTEAPSPYPKADTPVDASKNVTRLDQPRGNDLQKKDMNLDLKGEEEGGWKSRCSENIRDYTLLAKELYLLAFATGMQDATTFPDYHCFASNQTGNTVLLSVGVFRIGGDTFSLVNIGVSLALFVAGVLILGQIGNLLGVRKRWWLFLSSLLQTSLVFVAAALQYHLGVCDGTPLAKVIIALLGFASGGQVAMARSLKVTEITTAMATAGYVDIFIDPRILSRDNRSRDRRLLFLIALVAGSFDGAGAYEKVGSAFVLLISAVGKLIVTGLLLFNRRQILELTKTR